MNAEDDQGQTSLHYVFWGRLPSQEAGDIIDILVRNQAELDIQDSCGETPLHVACTGNGHKLPLITKLTGYGASLNVRCHKGKMAIHHICEWFEEDGDTLQCLELLVKFGVDIDAQDHIGNTALMLCIGRCSLDCVKLLLDNKANANLQVKRGATALHCAVQGVLDFERKLQTVQLLIDAGASVNVTHDRICQYKGDWKRDSENLLLIASMKIVELYPESIKDKSDIKVLMNLICSAGLDLCHISDVIHCLLCIDMLEMASHQNLTDNDIPFILHLFYRAGYKPKLNHVEQWQKQTRGYKSISQQLLDWFRQVDHQPYSLNNLCLFEVRRSVSTPLSRSVEILPVPTALKNSILFLDT